MEKSIKGTRTEQNLLKSFAGESRKKSLHVLRKRGQKRRLRTNCRCIYGNS